MGARTRPPTPAHRLSEHLTLPLHRQLAEELRRLISTGGYPPGSLLPSEHQLATRHGVSRGTVRQALGHLRVEGVISVRRGARPVVLSMPKAQTFTEMVSFSAWAHDSGRVPGGRVIELTRRVPTPEEADRLTVAASEPIWSLFRVRTLDGDPVMVERTIFPNAIGRLVAGMDLESGSIYAQLAAHGALPTSAEHVIAAVAASDDDGALLDVPPGWPLLRQHRRARAADGPVIEWSDDRYRGERVNFELRNNIAVHAFGRRHGPAPARFAAFAQNGFA